MTSTPPYIKAVMQGIPARWGFEGTVARTGRRLD